MKDNTPSFPTFKVLLLYFSSNFISMVLSIEGIIILTGSISYNIE